MHLMHDVVLFCIGADDSTQRALFVSSHEDAVVVAEVSSLFAYSAFLILG